MLYDCGDTGGFLEATLLWIHPIHQNLCRTQWPRVDNNIDSRDNQPRSQDVLTSYADHEAEGTPWYTSIKCAQNLGALAAFMDFTVPRQHESTENGRCSSAYSAEDKLRN